MSYSLVQYEGDEEITSRPNLWSEISLRNELKDNFSFQHVLSQSINTDVKIGII